MPDAPRYDGVYSLCLIWAYILIYCLSQEFSYVSDPSGGNICFFQVGDAADCTSFALQIKLMDRLLSYKLCSEQRPQG